MEKKKKIPTSKKLIYFLFINCTIIEIFTLVVISCTFPLAASIGVLPDFSPLVSLIGAVVTETIGFAVYSIKATKENTVGGITYDMAMKELNEEGNNNDINDNTL